MFMPFQILGLWIRTLVTLAALGVGIGLLALWFNHREHTVVEQAPPAAQREADPQAKAPEAEGPGRVQVRTVSWEFGWNKVTAYLLGGLALVVWSLGGSWVLSPRLWRGSGGKDEPHEEPPSRPQRIRRPDGSDLLVAVDGDPEGDSIICTHGWGLDHNEWFYTKRELSGYRVITWDLPGLGGSTRPEDRDWSLEKLARDLDSIIDFAGGKGVTLVGHSIGSMIILTYCSLFPQALGSRVARLVLVHGTYTNPVETCAQAGLYRALQKPVLEPLCHLMVGLSPVVRLLNWMSYLNGSAHWSAAHTSFSGNETRGQLDFMTWYFAKAPPDVVARGMLAMFRYDATETLARIPVPALVVAADGDPCCLPEASRFIAERIPRARLITLAPARHCGLFEWHGQFHEALVEFLADQDRAASSAMPTRQGRVPTA